MSAIDPDRVPTTLDEALEMLERRMSTEGRESLQNSDENPAAQTHQEFGMSLRKDLVGGEKVLKPALRLMTSYRLVIEEIKDARAVTSYTRWLDAVQVKGAENQEVYITFSPRFERIWLEANKRLLEYLAQNPGNVGLRSQYSLRLYGWAKKYAALGTKRILKSPDYAK